MGFFKSLKGKTQVGTDNPSTANESVASKNQYVSGTHDDLSNKEEKRRLFGNTSSNNPFRSQFSTTRPQSQSETFSQPPGPPPSHPSAFSPPPGPPPAQIPSENPPPYHDWTVIPDTSLLPPPPALPEDNSPANNASYDSSVAALKWCNTHPPFTPSTPSPEIHGAAQRGDLTLEKPSTFAKTSELRQLSAGSWSCKTRRGQPDTILLSNLPLYFASVDHPLHTEQQNTVYFEVRVLSIRDDESGVAIGFVAKPYPSWRLPGWQRASIGVHGDDGRRFMNDSWGGREFVRKFEQGDVVGVGMRFAVEESGAPGERKCKTKAFFTRNGREEGSWNVDEERDAERDEGVEGLQGELDIYPAVGVFGGVEVEVRFKREEWLYKMG